MRVLQAPVRSSGFAVPTNSNARLGNGQRRHHCHCRMAQRSDLPDRSTCGLVGIAALMPLGARPSPSWHLRVGVSSTRFIFVDGAITPIRCKVEASDYAVRPSRSNEGKPAAYGRCLAIGLLKSASASSQPLPRWSDMSRGRRHRQQRSAMSTGTRANFGTPSQAGHRRAPVDAIASKSIGTSLLPAAEQ
jgi:hypothetical protein